MGTKKLNKEEVNNRISDRGIIMLGEYVTTHTKTLFQCGKGHTWKARPSGVMRGSGCPQCSGRIRLTKEIVNDRIADRGLVMQSEYVHQKAKARFQCSKGHTWKTTPGNILSGTGCPKCGKVTAANKKRLSVNTIRDRLAGRGIVMVGEYVTTNTKTMFQCGKGHTWKATPGSVMHGRGCPHCAGRIPLTKEIVNDRIADRGITLLGEYVTTQTKTLFQCSKGHTWEAPPSRIMQGGGCPHCAGQYPLSKEVVNDRIADRGLVMLGEYVNVDTKTLFQCSEGHTWVTTPYHVMSRTGCPHCSRQAPLTTEIVNERIADRGLVLLDEFITNSVKVRFQCSEGHTWKAKPNNILSGKGCPECGKVTAANKIRLSVNTIRDRLADRGTVMLGEYVHIHTKTLFQCSEGHTWKATPNSVTRGHGCPYCAGQKPTADRNFATEFPELVKEWDFENNKNTRPENYTPRSKKKVWWRCEEGHSWQATICNRTRKWHSECPCCTNRMLCEDNSLAQVRPDIAIDWHPDKNAPLTPNDVIAGGSKKVWWICKHGHEWKATIGLRVISGTGCPKCSLQTSRIEIAVYSELYALFDDVAWREKIAGYECDIYLQDENIGIEIDGVYWHSQHPERELAKSTTFESEGLLLFRLREEGLQPLSERDVFFKSSDDKFLTVSRIASSLLKHARLSDSQRIKLRNYIEGPGLINEKLYRKIVARLPAPPLDQSLAIKQPDIAKQWAYDLNAPLLPEHFRCASSKKVWWRCPIGHTWKVSINGRTRRGPGCPACARQVISRTRSGSGRSARARQLGTDEYNLAVVYPDLASEWHPEKNGNLRPEDILPKSNQKIWWQCSKEHEWQAPPHSRAKGSGCPYCYGRYATKENNLASKHPELLKEWDQKKNEGLNPSDFTPRTNKKVWWRCSKGHSWQASLYNRSYLKSGCPDCNKARPSLRKYTIADMERIAEGKGGKCLSGEYQGLEVKLRWQCENGHQWEAIPNSLLYNNSWCPVCVGRNRDITDMHKLADKRNGKCLSPKYINSITKLKWQCEKGHTWEATPNHIKNAGTWCPVCCGTKKRTLKDMQVLAKGRRGKCLSHEYVNAKTKLKWQCEKEHVWEATPDHIKNAGAWCPVCARAARGKLK